MLVDQNPTAGIVGGRHHRYHRFTNVDAERFALREDIGEMRTKILQVQMTAIQKNEILPGDLHLVVDGPRHNIAGSK